VPRIKRARRSAGYQTRFPASLPSPALPRRYVFHRPLAAGRFIPQAARDGEQYHRRILIAAGRARDDVTDRPVGKSRSLRPSEHDRALATSQRDPREAAQSPRARACKRALGDTLRFVCLAR